MKKESKIKATRISFNSMTGICFENITFHDCENKIFVIGRERTKRQFRSLDGIVLVKGHCDEKKLEDMKQDVKEIEGFGVSRSRHYPPSCSDLKRDLEVVKELEKLEVMHGSFDDIKNNMNLKIKESEGV